jgi:hypothetical protein
MPRRVALFDKGSGYIKHWHILKSAEENDEAGQFHQLSENQVLW